MLGVSALFVACKYEEIYPPEVADFTYITDHAYAAKALDMEMKILLEFDWKITAPNAHLWIERLCAVCRASSRVKHRAKYYSQRTLAGARHGPCSTRGLKLRRRPSICRWWPRRARTVTIGSAGRGRAYG